MDEWDGDKVINKVHLKNKNISITLVWYYAFHRMTNTFTLLIIQFLITNTIGRWANIQKNIIQLIF